MKINILLTSVGGEMAPAIITHLKNIKKYKITVIGVDISNEAIGKNFCDFFYEVPRGEDKNYNNKILKISLKHKINLLIPTSDEEALNLSKINSVFQKNKIQLVATSHSTISIMNDKLKTYNFLKKNNINTPFYKKISRKKELLSEIKRSLLLYNEIVIKPSNARGGRNVFIISNKIKKYKIHNDRREIITDLNSFIKYFQKKLNGSYPLILMERLVEPVYDLDMLAWNGKSIAVVPRRRFNSAVPNDGHLIVSNQNLIKLGEKIINILNLSWLYECDIMFDEFGKPHILEINPRPSGSFVVCLYAGMPIIERLIDLSLGKKIRKLKIPYNKRIIPYKNLYII